MDDNPFTFFHGNVMLNLLPAPLHRLALRMAQAVRLRWWRHTGKTVHGCNVIVADSLGQVLLVQHSYHAKGAWMLPGGGLNQGENLLEGACRELAEEVRCVLDTPRHIDTLVLNRAGWTNVIEIVGGTTLDLPIPDGREIVRAQFFNPHTLPHPTSAQAQDMIARWLDDQNGSSV